MPSEQAQMIVVIIPTYNRKKFVIDAANSILNQKNPEGFSSHLVIVDDGGTDGTFEYFNALKTSRLTILKKNNAERGAARNFGARWANQNLNPNWFLFFDSDDCLLPDAFSLFASRLMADPRKVSAVYGSVAAWDGVQTINEFLLSPEYSKNTGPGLEGDLTRFVTQKMILGLGTTFIRSDLFEKVGGFPENRQMSGSEDAVFLIRIIRTGVILFIPRYMVLYRQHSDNTAPTQSLISIGLAIEALLPEFKLPAEKKMLRRLGVLLKAGAFNSRGYPKEAWKILLGHATNDRTIFLDPRSWRLLLSVGKRILAP